MFELHPKLKSDTIGITRSECALVLLMNHRAVPWLILVPERPGLTGLHALPARDRAGLMEDIVTASRVLERLYHPDKINVGSLGNLVPQLHVHVMGRFTTDRAWPRPYWGSGGNEPYAPDELARVVERLRESFTTEWKRHGEGRI